MDVEKLSKLPPIEIGFRIDPELPVIPLALQVSRAGCAAPHAHPRGQLIYASSGVMKVVCRRDVWVVPPSQAVWVPPEIEHEVYFPGDVSLRNLFIDPSVMADLPTECAVIKVTQLLRELILRAVEVGEAYTAGSAGHRRIPGTVYLNQKAANRSPLLSQSISPPNTTSPCRYHVVPDTPAEQVGVDAA